MPALPPVASVLRVDLFFTKGANTRVRDRIFLKYAGVGGNTTDLTTLATTIANAWGTNLSVLQTTDTTLNGITITDLTNTSAPQVVTSQSKVGTQGGGILPDSTAFIVKFKINRRYRGGHPRFYFCGLAPAQLAASGNTWLGSTVTNVSAGFANFITAAETAPPANVGALTHVNVGYFQGFTNKTFPSGRVHAVPTLRVSPTTDLVVGYSGNPNLASQRRRNQQSI